MNMHRKPSGDKGRPLMAVLEVRRYRAYAAPVTTVGAVVIGDEILTGKVVDVNAVKLIVLCANAGVRVERVVVVGDEPADIAEEVARLAGRCELVVTSGGVGPTHDDRTVEGVARAFGLAVVRDADLEGMIRGWWGDRLTPAALRMANVPEGSQLVFSSDAMLPIVVCRNVYLLPGIPRLFERKLEALRRVLVGEPVILGSVYLAADESDVADALAEVDRTHADVKIGSYPQPRDADHRVWITVEGSSREVVVAAIHDLTAALPADVVVRIDEP